MQKLKERFTNANAGAKGVMLAMVGFAAPVVHATETNEVPIDTADVEAQFGEIQTAVMAVGSVIITVAAVAVGFKWIKGMVFG